MVTPLLGVQSTQHGPYSTLRLDTVWQMTSKFCEVLIQHFETAFSSFYCLIVTISSGWHSSISCTPIFFLGQVKELGNAVGQACSSLVVSDPKIEGLVIQKVWRCQNVGSFNHHFKLIMFMCTFGNFAT